VQFQKCRKYLGKYKTIRKVLRKVKKKSQSAWFVNHVVAPRRIHGDIDVKGEVKGWVDPLLAGQMIMT
jgi:hypothetical protein